MNKKWDCEVITDSNEKFYVTYRSNMVSADDFPVNIIETVTYNGYELSVSKLRETMVWAEITTAIKHAAFDKWETEWRGYIERKENVVQQRYDIDKLLN